MPATTLTQSSGTPSDLARIFSTAAFALPRSAGVLTRTLRVSPSHAAIPSREEPGTTLIASLIFQSPSQSVARCARTVHFTRKSPWCQATDLAALPLGELIVYQLVKGLLQFCVSTAAIPMRTTDRPDSGFKRPSIVWWGVQLKQGSLAIVKNTSQLAVDEQGVNWPTARNFVIDLVINPRAILVIFKTMLVVPPTIRASELVIHETVGRLPGFDL